ncbi:hypothetical protein [Halorubrum lipolyticum]|uniref:hypothetical protein n=1 Tax=Halorubrum lipolyticum TaxID=368624 RepID=UPI0011CB5520|nr:hypothetical protein [Halorubrum lipolyticum]
MGQHEFSEGVEVSHSQYGRGCILDMIASQTGGIDDARVLFYLSGEEVTVPTYSLAPASEVTSVESTRGTLGTTVTIDDGFYTITVEPDGEGTGYNLSLQAGNAILDQAELSSDKLF